MKNKIALFFLVISLSTTIDSILVGKDIPSNIGSNKPDLAKIPPKQTETEAELKKGESYIPALIIFVPLFVKIIFGKTTS